jgi:hypothetical protein
MTSNLPPHLEQFVREQIAIGRFHSENEVIRAALQLLEGRFPSHPTSGPLPSNEINQVPGPKSTGQAARRRTPRGILADLRSDLCYDEIKEARSEMWSGFPRGAA